MEDELVELYRELSELTREICKTCDPPFECCTRDGKQAGCGQAKYWAKERFGVELTGNPEWPVPFLSPTGCIVEPHYRPLCSFFICDGKEKPPRYIELLRLIFAAEKRKQL